MINNIICSDTNISRSWVFTVSCKQKDKPLINAESLQVTYYEFKQR